MTVRLEDPDIFHLFRHHHFDATSLEIRVIPEPYSSSILYYALGSRPNFVNRKDSASYSEKQNATNASS